MAIDQPEHAAMLRLLEGGWVAHIIHTTAELGIADHLGAEPQDVASLAVSTGTHAASLARLMRTLAAIGIVLETADRHYTITPLGATLKSDQPGSMRAWARLILGDEDGRMWQGLSHAIRTGDYAYRHVFGMDVWAYRSAHPETARVFNDAIESFSQSVNAAISAHYPFGRFGWIVDVGGGNGGFLLPILQRHPAMRGTIVELAHVAAQARERILAAGLGSRCEALAGDALVAVPPGADAYVVKGVIHGRNDDEAVAILLNCRNAMSAGRKLLVIERVLPEQVQPDDDLAQTRFLMDINMMIVSPGGRERTRTEYQNLLTGAGLRLLHVVNTPSPSVVIEAEPA